MSEGCEFWYGVGYEWGLGILVRCWVMNEGCGDFGTVWVMSDVCGFWYGVGRDWRLWILLRWGSWVKVVDVCMIWVMREGCGFWYGVGYVWRLWILVRCVFLMNENSGNKIGPRVNQNFWSGLCAKIVLEWVVAKTSWWGNGYDWILGMVWVMNVVRHCMMKVEWKLRVMQETVEMHSKVLWNDSRLKYVDTVLVTTKNYAFSKMNCEWLNLKWKFSIHIYSVYNIYLHLISTISSYT